MIGDGSPDSEDDFDRSRDSCGPECAMLNDDQDEEMAEGQISKVPPDALPTGHPVANATSKPPPTHTLEVAPAYTDFSHRSIA
ncbi:hypothetical protein FRC12_013274 [Ceratobasidium sp. 428]|nr:hypothetical protein FRC12_013274 [Ceratobasidium sp. 428]